MAYPQFSDPVGIGASQTLSGRTTNDSSEAYEIYALEDTTFTAISMDNKETASLTDDFTSSGGVLSLVKGELIWGAWSEISVTTGKLLVNQKLGQR